MQIAKMKKNAILVYHMRFGNFITHHFLRQQIKHLRHYFFFFGHEKGVCLCFFFCVNNGFMGNML